MFTPVLFLFISSFSSLGQPIIGDPIDCWTPEYFKGMLGKIISFSMIIHIFPIFPDFVEHTALISGIALIDLIFLLS